MSNVYQLFLSLFFLVLSFMLFTIFRLQIFFIRLFMYFSCIFFVSKLRQHLFQFSICVSLFPSKSTGIFLDTFKTNVFSPLISSVESQNKPVSFFEIVFYFLHVFKLTLVFIHSLFESNQASTEILLLL